MTEVVGRSSIIVAREQAQAVLPAVPLGAWLKKCLFF